MAQASQLSPPVHSLSDGARAILDVAKQLFAEKGFDAVSINQIAQQAGVSKANVFHHFTSKDGLYLAVLKAACEEVAWPWLIAAEAQVWICGRFFHHTLRPCWKTTIRQSSSCVKSWKARTNGSRHLRSKYSPSDGQAQGLLRKDFDPALLAYLMLSANVFFFENHTVTAHLSEGGFARSADRYSHDVFRLLLQGALVDPETDFQFTGA